MKKNKSKRTISSSSKTYDGIIQSELYHVRLDENPEEFWEVLNSLTLEGQIDRLVRQARNELVRREASYVDYSGIRVKDRPITPERYACDAIRHFESVVPLLEQGRPEDAVMNALWGMQFYQSIVIANWELDARIGRQQRQGGRGAGGIPKVDWVRVQKEADKLWRSNSLLSKSDVARRVAPKFPDVKPDTIRKNLVRPNA